MTGAVTLTLGRKTKFFLPATTVTRIPQQQSVQNVNPGEEKSPTAPFEDSNTRPFDHDSGVLTAKLCPSLCRRPEAKASTGALNAAG